MFEAANDGTIFLDEISATTPALQIRLLRVLQEREFMRVGGTSEIKVDTRVIAASNRDLLDEVSKGTFRQDLYYRLNVIPIHLPPLRDRKEDIPLLVDFFLNKFSAGRKPKRIDSGRPQTAYRLSLAGKCPGAREHHRTPGHPAQTGRLITGEHIPDAMKNFSLHEELIPDEIPDEGIDLEGLLGSAEQNLLQKALENTGGVKTEAASCWASLSGPFGTGSRNTSHLPAPRPFFDCKEPIIPLKFTFYGLR